MKLLTKKGDLKMTLLTETEVRKVSEQFSGKFEVRNKGLFMLGVSTGADIKELLALTIGDIYQNDKLVDKLFFNNRDGVSRTVPVNHDGIKAIRSLIDWHVENYGSIDTQRPLFPSRNRKGKVALSSRRAHEVLRAAFIAAELSYKQTMQPLQRPIVRRTHEPARYTVVVGIQGQSNSNTISNTMLMYVHLNGESVKDFIIKRIKLIIKLIKQGISVVIVLRQAYEWLLALLGFILRIF